MKAGRALGATVVVVALLQLATETSAVVGGSRPLDVMYGSNPVDEHGDWVHEGKWAVHVRVPLSGDPTRVGHCSGAVIDAHWVVTARHCVDNYFRAWDEPRDLIPAPANLHLDTEYEDQERVWHEINTIVRHMSSDVAMLYMERPYEVEFADGTVGVPQAPPLATSRPTVGWGAIGYGFGKTEGDDEGEMSRLVKVAGLVLTNDQGTKLGGPFDWYDAASVECPDPQGRGRLVYPPGRSNGGDSGGPVVSHRGNHEHTLSGLMVGHSGSDADDDSKVTPLYDKVDWIHDTMNRQFSDWFVGNRMEGPDGSGVDHPGEP